jgi:hypothetical protein
MIMVHHYIQIGTEQVSVFEGHGSSVNFPHPDFWTARRDRARPNWPSPTQLVTIIGSTESTARKMLTLDCTPGCTFLERSQADAKWDHREEARPQR